MPALVRGEGAITGPHLRLDSAAHSPRGTNPAGYAPPERYAGTAWSLQGGAKPPYGAHRSILPVNALAPLVALLGFDRERRDRTRFKPLEGDRLAGFLAVAVGTLVETGQRLIDLGDELALPVAGAQLDRAVRFRGCAVGQIRVVLVFSLEMSQGFLGFLQD